jgi:hypothetical protein
MGSLYTYNSRERLEPMLCISEELQDGVTINSGTGAAVFKTVSVAWCNDRS